MTKRNHTPIRRATTSTPSPATADPQPDSEAPWQQLMVFNYVVHEAMDAMRRERVEAGHGRPLTQSWQAFVHHLRRQKPKLNACLDTLLQEELLDPAAPPSGRARQ